MADLTVVIPAFNAETHISDAVKSGLSSGATEVIVVDDGSTDDTATVAMHAGARVLRQDNAGAAAARRAGVDASGGEFVVLLDADDQLIETGVRRSLELLEATPSLVLAGGRTVGVGRGGHQRELSLWPEGVTLSSLLARGHAPGPPGAFVWRRDGLVSVLSRDPEPVWPRYAEDYEFLLRASLRGEIAMHPVVACRYAWVGGKSSKSPQKSIRDAERIRIRYSEFARERIEPRTQRELARMVLMRRASEQLGATRALERLSLITSALLKDPAFALDRLRTRLRRFCASNRGEQSTLAQSLNADWRANPRDPKAILVLTMFRLSHAAMGNSRLRRILASPLEVTYRVVTEGLLGVELRPRTQVGPGLSIYHGFGIVVNDHARIGANVAIRNSVTIGHQHPGGGCPVIGDGVSIGAGAIILGDITIGDGARIGAGAVVIRSVEPGDVVVGNPARSLRRSAAASLEPESHTILEENPA